MEFTDADYARFAAKIDAPDDLNDPIPCWIWIGARHSKKRGYGKFRLVVNGQPKVMNAHKAAYLLLVGEVEDGQVIGHQCNHEWCVSPWHLVAQTQTENMKYCVASGRHASQRK